MPGINSYIKICISAATALLLTLSCQRNEPDHYDNMEVMESLWSLIDTRYCYLDEKNLDWDMIREAYRSKISEDQSPAELFGVLSEMLNELKDGHVNLQSDFNVSYYRAWWSDYPQNFNERTLYQYYLDFDWDTTGGLIYKKIAGDVGYIRYPSFSYTVSHSAINNILMDFVSCRALIIDIRDNGGGALTNVEALVSHFIDKEITAGYIIHKTGPGRNDFSKPFKFCYSPAGKGNVKWLRPIIVLANRSCYSAANNFASIISTLPNVTMIGSKTGGGGGLPFTYELNNGWMVRFSACPILDPMGVDREFGVDVTPGFEVNCPPEQLATGKDAILDRAIEYAKTLPPVVQ